MSKEGKKHIILLRGLVREVRHWGDFPAMLNRSGYKCSCLEIPGVGQRHKETSPLKIEDYVSALRFQFLNLKKSSPEDEFYIIAISMGGMITQSWLSMFPSDFKASIIINSSGGNLSAFYKKLSPKAIKTLGALFMNNNLKQRTIEILELTTNMTELSDALVNKWVSFDKEFTIKRLTFLRQISAAARFKVPAREDISTPLLFLCGKKDELVNHRCSIDLAEYYHSNYFIHPEAGHDIPLDDPDWIISHANKFF